MDRRVRGRPQSQDSPAGPKPLVTVIGFRVVVTHVTQWEGGARTWWPLDQLYRPYVVRFRALSVR